MGGDLDEGVRRPLKKAKDDDPEFDELDLGELDIAEFMIARPEDENKYRRLHDSELECAYQLGNYQYAQCANKV